MHVGTTHFVGGKLVLASLVDANASGYDSFHGVNPRWKKQAQFAHEKKAVKYMLDISRMMRGRLG